MLSLADEIFQAFAFFLSATFAIYPNFSIKVLSYGKHCAQDINPTLLLTVRCLAGFVVLSLTVQLLAAVL
jgi:hypothetical protein